MVPSRFSLSEEGITLKAHIGRGPLHEYLPTVAELDMASPLDPALLSFADKRASLSGQCAVSDLCGDAVVPVRGMQQSRDISMWDNFHMGHTNQNCSLRRGTACNNLSLLHQIKMAELCIEACEKCVRVTFYKELPVTLRREFYECFGVTPRAWLFQPVWEAMMQDWCRGPHRFANTGATLQRDRGKFTTEAQFRSALGVYEKHMDDHLSMR
eukprot:s4038_g4.t1